MIPPRPGRPSPRGWARKARIGAVRMTDAPPAGGYVGWFRVDANGQTRGLRALRHGSAGQAAVETAVVLPLMLFLVLGAIQLTMVQHARLMTEYAAFNAARTGIVWNGNQCMMRRAAVVSLLPTLAATDTLSGTSEPLGSPRPGLLQTWAKYHVLAEGGQAIRGALADLGITGVPLVPIDVELLAPTEATASDFMQGGKEIDFDAVAGVPDGDDFEERDTMRDATLLTVRVTLLYPMRIPFANWMVFYSWLASHANLVLTGSITSATVATHQSKSIVADGMGGQVEGAKALARTEAEQDAEGREIFSPWLIGALWELGLTQDAWFFPLEASHTMRMQSNVYAANLGEAGRTAPCPGAD